MKYNLNLSFDVLVYISKFDPRCSLMNFLCSLRSPEGNENKEVQKVIRELGIIIEDHPGIGSARLGYLVMQLVCALQKSANKPIKALFSILKQHPKGISLIQIHKLLKVMGVDDSDRECAITYGLASRCMSEERGLFKFSAIFDCSSHLMKIKNLPPLFF